MREDILAVEEDLARGRGRQPQDGPADRRLAAARLAHQPHGLVLLQVKAHPVHGRDGLLLFLERGKEPLAVGEVLFEVYDFENGL